MTQHKVNHKGMGWPISCPTLHMCVSVSA